MANNLLSIQNHLITKQINLSLRTISRLKSIDPNYTELIRKNLIREANKEFENNFDQSRSYEINIEPNLVRIPHQNTPLTHTFTQAIYCYLKDPNEAELNEVIAPKAFEDYDISFEDNVLETLPSNRQYEAHFDHNLIKLLPIITPEQAIKYFVRIA